MDTPASQLHLYCATELVVVADHSIGQRHYIAAFDLFSAMRLYASSAAASALRACSFVRVQIAEVEWFGPRCFPSTPGTREASLARSKLAESCAPRVVFSTTPEDVEGTW